MIAWTTVEDAIHAWVVAGSGLAATQVIWAADGGPRPSGTYIAISPPAVRRIGHDWVDVRDNGDDTFDYVARGVREMTIGLQCFGDTPIGATGATQILDAVASSLRLPSVREALNAAGVGVARAGNVTAIGGVRADAIFEPRGVVEFAAFLASDVEEAGNIIETAETAYEAP